jgi:acyl-CoA carboxylase subunit beta
MPKVHDRIAIVQNVGMRSDASLPTAGARAAIEAVADDFVEHDVGVVSRDPLGWPGYREQLERARDRTGERESVVCGEARVGARRVAVIAFDFAFLGGSLGEQSGRKIAHTLDIACRAHRPVVSLVASGGCRMQEGMRALVGMQRIAKALERVRRAGLAHVAVVRDPTTGGVWAALAAAADVVLATPDARVAFAGHRARTAATDPPASVDPRTVAPEPSASDDADAFTAVGKVLSGQVDLLVPEAHLRETLGTYVDLLAPPRGAGHPRAEVPTPLAASTQPPATGADAVRRARDPNRPRANAYLDAYFDVRLPISGDRAGGTDPGMFCGIGRRSDGTVAAYAAQAGVPNTPAGFRTAARLVRLADRVGLPILTLIDTPGAANDAAAERAAIGPAIADLFAAVAAATVPVTSLVIGEGGSGGALALASHTDLWIAPDAYFAVIAPEAATAILKRPPDETAAVAGHLRLRPQDLVELGVVRGVAGDGA